MERHRRDAYYIVGEGMVDGAEVTPGAQVAMDVDLHAFRFSRIGPKGRQLGDPARRRIAVAMTRDAGKRDSKIPAGYTYLGQFVDHDLTFDRSRLRDDASVPVADLVQGRSPSLDLDSLYGLGPAMTPEFYRSGKLRLKTGDTVASFPNDGIANRVQRGFDLPRRPDRTAVIPDPRNDENLVVAQTHLAFIRFHNRVVEVLLADGVPQAEVFARARDTVVRHYQWMLKTDFLPRVVNPQQVAGVFSAGRRIVEPGAAPGTTPTMPIEFSVAAYRMGHSMVRAAYDWNRVFDDGAGSIDLLFEFSGTSGGLGGDPRLPTNWIADFRRLYDFREAGRPDLRPLVGGKLKLNFARRIDTLLADPLAFLPDDSLGGPDGAAIRHNLAFRNLTRARMLQLATGQQMAALMRRAGLPIATLTPQRILRGRDGADLGALNQAQRQALTRDTPLWFYVLREAEWNASPRLTGVGGRLVAETFHRAMEGSEISIVRDPAWRPTLGPDPETFRMVDLLLFAFEGRAELLNPLG
ncbi:MAG: heme peroxidase family protein [Thermoleophilia bacterium]